MSGANFEALHLSLHLIPGVCFKPFGCAGDEVCPENFAQDLVAGLERAGVPHVANFIDAGHMAKSDGMSTALRGCVDEFLAGYRK